MAADIEVETSALREFAANSQIDLDVDALRALASKAGQATSMMTEGSAFYQANAAAKQWVLQQAGLIKAGDRTYREGAARDADLYDSTEHQAVNTMRSVPAFTSKLGLSDEADRTASV